MTTVAAVADGWWYTALLSGNRRILAFQTDADLPAAADAAVFGICFNQGECCNSGSRLIVQRPIVEQFLNKLIELVRQVPIGDPLDEKTKIGAIASEAQYAKILGYI